nr:zinc finger, CCHC-type [Tanacetum cinerariifolium]
EDHTFEVEPHGNVDHVASLQEVQTQDLIYYHLARDREQHSKHELFNYREDNNEAPFAVAKVEKIYAHESLTFNNTVAIEVIFKWKVGLKDDMDALSDVYVLSNGCKKCNDDSDAEILATKGLLDKAKGNVLGMEIVKDKSGNTLRVSQSRFYNEKLVQTLLEGHSILSLSLEGSLSGDCDVKNNGDLAVIDTAISDEDRALLLLAFLPSYYDYFIETLLYGQDTLKLEDVLATLNSRKLQKMTKANGDGGEGLYVRERSGQINIVYNHKKSQGFFRNKDQLSGYAGDGYDSADVMMAMSVEELLDWIMDSGSSTDEGWVKFRVNNVGYVPELRRNLISLGILENEGFTVKMQSGKIKVINGSLVELSETRRVNCVYTLDGQAVTKKTLKGRKQLGEYQTRWKIKTGNVLDLCNQRST